MSVSIRTKTKFPLLTTTALASTALMSAALLTVAPTAAQAQTISTAVVATQNLGGGGVLIVTGSGSISGVNPAVSVNAVAATSVTNDGTISGTNRGIWVRNAGGDITGGVTNNLGGVISGFGQQGIQVIGSANISGGITNYGTISALSAFGIGIWSTLNSDISGGVVNNSSGVISGGSTGVWSSNNSDIAGGIINYAGGIISGGTYAGIDVSAASDITGGINNSGTISGGSGGVNVRSNSDILGGVNNSGTISGNTGISLLSTSDISGGITNNAGGTISGLGQGSTRGAIMIRGNSDILDGITNRGLISGLGIGIGVQNSDISGGVINSGTLTGGGSYYGFQITSAANISGGITNQVGGLITASGSGGGISVRNAGSNVSGGITNSGTISGNTGILLSGANISGGITNNVGGIIQGVGNAILVVSASSDISAGIVNSGTISGNRGIYVTSAPISGGITNEVGGIIEGTGGTAIQLTNLSADTPITINGGRIIGDVVDTNTATNRSTTTIAGDFTTAGNFMVSGLTVSAGQTLTISEDNTVSMRTMSASAGTFSFAVDSAMSAGQLIVTNGAVNLTGASVSATVLNAGANLTNGAEILIADGSVQVVGLTGALGQVATRIADNTILWNFLIADGSQVAVTGSMDNTQLYMIAQQAATISATATAPNAQNAGAVFDGVSGTTNPQLSSIVANINAASTTEELDALLEATLPTVDSGALIGGLRLSENTLEITRTQLASLRDGEATGIAAGDHPSGLRAWGQVFGESADQDRRDSVSGYDAQTLGVALGMDTQNAAEDTTLGLALSYGHTDVDSDNANRTETDVDGYQVTLYGDHDFDDRTYITGLLGYVYGDNESTRHDVGGVAGLTANADYASHQFVAEVETGRDYKVGSMKLTPNVLASYTHYSAEDYVETGAGGANLNVENEDLQMLELGVGLTAGWEHQTDAGGVLKPELRVGYRYDVIGDPVASTSRFTGGGASFKTEGFDPAQSSFNLGTGLTYTTPQNWELSASYDYEFKQDFDAHSGFLKAGYKF